MNSRSTPIEYSLVSAPNFSVLPEMIQWMGNSIEIRRIIYTFLSTRLSIFSIRVRFRLPPFSSDSSYSSSEFIHILSPLSPSQNDNNVINYIHNIPISFYYSNHPLNLHLLLRFLQHKLTRKRESWNQRWIVYSKISRGNSLELLIDFFSHSDNFNLFIVINVVDIDWPSSTFTNEWMWMVLDTSNQ